MNSNDKTRQKLVDSMRKTKVSATKKAAPKAKVAPKEPASKPAPAASKRAVKKPQQKATTAASSPVNADQYQSGRRIWPD
jgi:hypothetical protein